MEINKIIKQARINAGLSQQRLSELSGIRKASISEFETGKRQLYVNNLSKLMDVLNLIISKHEN